MDDRVTIDDVRRAGYCVAGARRWFATHEIDFADFLRNGLPAEEFVARGDELAKQVVDKKFERAAALVVEQERERG